MMFACFSGSRFITYRALRFCSDFPKGCGWESILNRARCKKEAVQLNSQEECGICVPIPQPEKSIETSDETDLTPINHIPDYVYNQNTVYIGRRVKNAMQSGTANTHSYVLSFSTDVTWENPLMGWVSGSNSLKDVEIDFPSIESAVDYCERNGWTFLPPDDHERAPKLRKKNYADNFSWDKKTRVSTK